MAARIDAGERDGLAVRTLVAGEGELDATWVPGVGMIGCSLRHRGEELLGQRRGLTAYAQSGSTMGIPLLHPWANRLDGLRYRVGARRVELSPELPRLRLDPGGLPIHGVCAACPWWSVVDERIDGDVATLRARLDFGHHEELMAAFPFPHVLEYAVTLAPGRLTLETVLSATGADPVPVSFGFHPYLVLPGERRSDWEIELPARERLAVDSRGIPTGAREPFSRPPGPLGGETWDDGLTGIDRDVPFTLTGGGRRIAVRFERGYPFAQVYAPEGDDVICFEPMTAPTNALVTGSPDLPLVAPGETFTTAWTVTVQDA